MSDVRSNKSRHPTLEQNDTAEAAEADAGLRMEQAKRPAADYDKARKTGPPERALEQQAHSMAPATTDLNNAVEAGMQSATDWLLRQQGKLMEVESEHREASSKLADAHGSDSRGGSTSEAEKARK